MKIFWLETNGAASGILKSAYGLNQSNERARFPFTLINVIAMKKSYSSAYAIPGNHIEMGKMSH